MSFEVPDYSGYQRLPSWILGFHGCDEKVAEEVLASQILDLELSSNPYDWLGDGIYFWENDPARAMQFAVDGMKKPITQGRIETPCVIGAVIDLGLCLNMFDQAALQELKSAAESYLDIYGGEGGVLPKNRADGRRFLDREMFEHLHLLRDLIELDPFDTVRAAFPEGAPLYGGTTITEKNHIQIAVRDARMIRGYFRPRLEYSPPNDPTLLVESIAKG